MAQLNVPFRQVEMDIMKGESRTLEFLAINPNGKVPTLVLQSGRVITESNAALFYLAEGCPSYQMTDTTVRRCCSGCSSSSIATSPP